MIRRPPPTRAIHGYEKFNGNCRNRFCFIISISSIFWFLLFFFHSTTLTAPKNDIRSIPDKYLNLASQRDVYTEQPHIDNQSPTSQDIQTQPPINQTPIIDNWAAPNSDPCSDQYIYVHDLPSRFNEDMLKDCKKLSLWTDMCRFTSNAGLGPTLDNKDGVFSNKGWFATNQFAVDVIFNNRMKKYKCLTNDSSKASAIFLPFYAGLDISRYLWGFNTTVRDSASIDLIKWAAEQPEWQIMGGMDHFLVAGRITWDFRRQTDQENEWGNKLMLLPEAKNMTMLVIESSPWDGNDRGIPYPTYFHPSNDNQIIQWQNRMRGLRRRWLFAFAGGLRTNIPGSIRGQIIEQCRSSKRGKLLECDAGASKCHSPSSVMKIFQRSVFCLQPQGDSYTRRSTFDSMLAGCIPVFFHPGSAYVQYTWHLPRNYTRYSVFIPEGDVREGKVSVEKRLLEIPISEVKEMRRNVIGMIPRLIYADPRSRLERFEDAFDVAVKGVIEKVRRLKKEMRGGILKVGFEEEMSWKYDLVGRVGDHEWDHFFSKPKD
ncbi:xyloglucan galactosyltransferase MUR3-like [Magnolia sinica]|uniref:xyloglucan galactosyltransferase MUR3-like n=1 Tax=Magnolia sinica TaxID=86752 RepID=UPI00265A2222|nr:xyloglucan galactosyltransferase MUR3-like [Magnolia sinica]